jgi:hypothetical protein
MLNSATSLALAESDLSGDADTTPLEELPFQLGPEAQPLVGPPVSPSTRLSKSFQSQVLCEPWGESVDTVGAFYAAHGVGMLGAYARLEWDDGFLPLAVCGTIPPSKHKEIRHLAFIYLLLLSDVFCGVCLLVAVPATAQTNFVAVELCAEAAFNLLLCNGRGQGRCCGCTSVKRPLSEHCLVRCTVLVFETR